MQKDQEMMQQEFEQIRDRVFSLTNATNSPNTLDFDAIENQLCRLRALAKRALSESLDPQITREILRTQILTSDFLEYHRFRSPL